MTTNYHTPIPAAPEKPEATSDLFNSRFADLDSGISGKLDPTGDGSNLTNSISQASTRTNLTSGEKLSLSLGKIKKWFADLSAIAFSGAYADLSGAPTTMDPTTHATSHAAAGSDPLTLTKAQISDFPTSMDPTEHATSHAAAGSDPLTLTKAQISDFPTSLDPTAHATSHAAAGSDPIDPDDIGAMAADGIKAGTNVTITVDPIDGKQVINAAGSGSGGSAHVISDDGTVLAQQGVLDFQGGLAAADDAVGFKTIAKLADMPAKTIKGNNQTSTSAPDDLSVDETAEMMFGGLSAETTPAPSDTDQLISEISRSSVVSRVLVAFSTIKSYVLGTLFDISSGHDHDGTDSKKIAYANVTGTPTIPTVPSFETSASNIKADGTASVGSLSTLARADHVHPNNDTGWISVTLENSWTVYTDWAGRFQYRKLFGGIVMLKLIAVYNASNQSAGNILTTLPANYYPVNDLLIATYATNGAFDSVLQIQNGVVKLKTAYTANVKLFASVVYFIG